MTSAYRHRHIGVNVLSIRVSGGHVRSLCIARGHVFMYRKSQRVVCIARGHVCMYRKRSMYLRTRHVSQRYMPLDVSERYMPSLRTSALLMMQCVDTRHLCVQVYCCHSLCILELFALDIHPRWHTVRHTTLACTHTPAHCH